MSTRLVDSMVNMQEEDALLIVKEELDKGEDPFTILGDCQKAMKIVGEKYEKGEYFVSELVVSSVMLREISDILKPKLETSQKTGRGEAKRGTIVLGTVRGDIHDIGKDVVGLMLNTNGFEVRDLGVDVPEQSFVEAVKESKPQVVALSGFLTIAYDAMKSTIEALDQAGLRKGVKVMIGGGQMDDAVMKYVKADGYGLDAMTAVRLAKGGIPAGK